jgi:uncharacterized protein YoxC
MNALQVYSNTNNYYYIFIYVSVFTIISITIMHLYIYFIEYTEEVNSKIEHISKISVVQSHIIQEKDDNITQLQNKVNLLEQKLNHISEHSHTNMDKIFGIETSLININSNISELTNKISCNNKDMYYIERRITQVETMTPNYVLIGINLGENLRQSIPIFVPNDFTFTEANIRAYRLTDTSTILITRHFQYLKNIKDINLDVFNLEKTLFAFSFNLPSFVDRCQGRENHIIEIASVHLTKYDMNNNLNRKYIPFIQDEHNKTYYKKGLRTLKSELSKMHIKLILNEDFEEFVRE